MLIKYNFWKFLIMYVLEPFSERRQRTRNPYKCSFEDMMDANVIGDKVFAFNLELHNMRRRILRTAWKRQSNRKGHEGRECRGSQFW